MKKSIIIIVLLIIVSGIVGYFYIKQNKKSTFGIGGNRITKEPSFSFSEIKDSEKISLDAPLFATASDEIKLAYYPIKAKNPIAGLVFIHGGGAYSGAGYQYLAKGLSEKYQTSVYLVDLRGHGNSGGVSGDAPSPVQVFEDLKLIIGLAKKDNPKLPLYLGGHSSGGGLILNYLDWYEDTNIDGYIFISPQLGYKSQTAREKIQTPFTKVNTMLFIMNGISQGRLFGNTPAVFFNYPDNVIKEKPLLIKSITCIMSLAITPNNPQEQFRNLNKPFGLFIGEKDELFDPEKVINYAELPPPEIREQSVSRIVENEKHLSILKIADSLIGNSIDKWAK